MAKDLNYYIDCFSSLNTMKKSGKPAPHKALLLLSVIDLVERVVITDCRIPLSDELIRQFKRNTSALLGESKLFQPVANYPYYHMKSEPFWQLVANSNCQIDKISNYSLPNLRANIAYARIDEEVDSELLEFINNKLELYNKFTEDRANAILKQMWFNELYDARIRGIQI